MKHTIVAEAALAYALFDARNTSRLGEQEMSVIDEYIKEARAILYMIKEYRTKEEREAISKFILEG